MSDNNTVPVHRTTTRAILVLGKFRVSERREGSMKIQLGPASMTVMLPSGMYDVREGDIITLYTEVPLVGSKQAN